MKPQPVHQGSHVTIAQVTYIPGREPSSAMTASWYSYQFLPPSITKRGIGCTKSKWQQEKKKKSSHSDILKHRLYISPKLYFEDVSYRVGLH